MSTPTPATGAAAAQSQLDALREEVARLTKELRNSNAMREENADSIAGLRTQVENWQAVVWAVARELNCLPSTFSDGNAHILKAAIKLNAELAALKAQPTDIDALMALADEYARADVCCVLTAETADWHENNRIKESAREALRAKLAARKELT